jgi:hypothetical protein
VVSAPSDCLSLRARKRLLLSGGADRPMVLWIGGLVPRVGGLRCGGAIIGRRGRGGAGGQRHPLINPKGRGSM